MDSITTSRSTREHYKTTIAVRNHNILADEPIDAGGTDLAPTPAEYMCAALASCTTITLRMYADRKEWPMEEAIVSVRFERIKDEESGELYTEFHKDIRFVGDLDEKQIKRLMQIAEKCPVNKIIKGKVNMNLHLVEE